MIKNNETGLIFENQNSLQLASRLVEVMSNSQLRHQLETNAKAWGEIQWSSKLLYERTMNIYNQVLETTKSLIRKTVTEPNLEGQYGLSKDKGIQKDSVASIFTFEVDNNINTNDVWEVILGNLPNAYSIPDTAFIKTITNSY
jgi:hypothetical protein